MMRFNLNPICKECKAGEQHGTSFFLCNNTKVSFDYHDPSYYVSTTGEPCEWIDVDLSKYCPHYKKLTLLNKLSTI